MAPSMIRALALVLLFASAFVLPDVSAFVPAVPQATLTAATRPSPNLSLLPGAANRRTSLSMADDPRNVDGTGRGSFIWVGVLLACVWLFSIPPEFRRAHFCAVERCVQDRASCYDCVTFQEWKEGISSYYANGGGIEFDFTVADETKQFWKDAVSGN